MKRITIIKDMTARCDECDFEVALTARTHPVAVVRAEAERHVMEANHVVRLAIASVEVIYLEGKE